MAVIIRLHLEFMKKPFTFPLDCMNATVSTQYYIVFKHFGQNNTKIIFYSMTHICYKHELF